MTQASPPERDPLTGEVDVIVVGAGFAGLYMLHRLRQAGLKVQGFETGHGVGGTWYWNRYPGARCDIPSLMYSYTWDEDLRREWRWSERYAAQPEILRYAEHVADRFDLKKLIAFDTRVVSAIFDEAANLWRIETDRGDRLAARWCVMATGCLSAPRSPDIEGEEIFEGARYHTGLWPHEKVDFTGLAVAVIGTGSSGVQSIPEIAREAKSVTVFQRTPNFSIPAWNRPLSDEDYAEFEKGYAEYLHTRVRGPGDALAKPTPAEPISDEQRRQRFEELWRIGGPTFTVATPDILTNIEANDAAAEFVRDRIGERVRDAKTAEALKPRDHPIGAKRLCVDTEYYETYNRPNVALVNLRETPIQAITPKGVRTTEREYAFDAIVFATGFDAMTGALNAIDIRGVGDASLKDVWVSGPRAYLGLAVAGFPNLFLVTGPGSPSVLSNVLNSIEQHVDWITDCITALRARGSKRIEATVDAEEAWVRHVADVGDRSLFPRANSWYMGANVPGKPRVFMAYIGAGYRAKCDEVAERGYEGFELA